MSDYFIIQAIRPVFDRLANKELIEACSRGLTQNANESFHHLVWSLVPKGLPASANEVNMGSKLAVLFWNLDREETLSRVIREITGVTLPRDSSKALGRIDRHRAAIGLHCHSPEKVRHEMVNMRIRLNHLLISLESYIFQLYPCNISIITFPQCSRPRGDE